MTRKCFGTPSGIQMWLLWCVSCRARRPIPSPPCPCRPHIMKTDSRKCERPPSSLASQGDICDLKIPLKSWGARFKLRLNQFCFFWTARLGSQWWPAWRIIKTWLKYHLSWFISGHNWSKGIEFEKFWDILLLGWFSLCWNIHEFMEMDWRSPGLKSWRWCFGYNHV